MLTRLNAGGQIAWSDPVEVIVDNDPPTLESVGILPASLVAQGTDVEVQVVSSDGGLSGVETVQLMRDAKLRGQWEPGGQIIVCMRTTMANGLAKYKLRHCQLVA